MDACTHAKRQIVASPPSLTTSDGPTPAEEAAATVPTITGKKITVPERAKPEARSAPRRK